MKLRLRIGSPATLVGILTLASVLGGCGREVSGSGEPENPTAQGAAATAGSPPLHPAFTFTEDDLPVLTGSARSEVARRIRNQPGAFLELARQLLDQPHWTLVLVDKQNPLGADYDPPDLVPIVDVAPRVSVRVRSMLLLPEVAEELQRLSDAAQADGHQLQVSSAYRSYQRQEELFAYWSETYSVAEAEFFSARAGTSQHQLGSTVDFAPVDPSFGGTPAYRWLLENAGAFGFSLSYPEGYTADTGYNFEPWHWRYIGRAGTEMETRFFGGIQQHFLEYWQEMAGALEDARARPQTPAQGAP